MILQPPHFRVLRQGESGYKPRSFEVTQAMLYRWDNKALVTVDEGFVTDFASVPRGFRNFFIVNSAHRLPALLHDYLYARRGVILSSFGEVHYTRKEADQAFLEAMKNEGVGFFSRRIMYRAVRTFGWLHSGGWNT